mmetsp:Transcript_115108/g.279331  ORF Transcript_115108/g.279331 Transcript_115108/m.279331 type:complete len:109 (+) Transcript_115108:18-344(+)
MQCQAIHAWDWLCQSHVSCRSVRRPHSDSCYRQPDKSNSCSAQFCGKTTTPSVKKNASGSMKARSRITQAALMKMGLPKRLRYFLTLCATRAILGRLSVWTSGLTILK